MNTKGIIFYTNNNLDDVIRINVQAHTLMSGLPVTSISLKPIDFGDNHIVVGESGYVTMIKQIIAGLSIAEQKYVFFCEHDVLYHKSHFEFTPPKDNIWYYNKNVWRWKKGDDHAIRYDRMLPLSTLCVNREFALDHYLRRYKKMEEIGLDQFESREPSIARKWGYEPGTKKMKRGGFSDDDFETWESKYPNIDIRHKDTFSPSKVTLDSFKHKPTGWEEISVNKIPGWSL